MRAVGTRLGGRLPPGSLRKGAMPARALALAVVLAAVLGCWTAAPAGAHTDLAATEPAAGSTATSPVTSVVLTFTSPVEVVGEGTALLGADGGELAVAEVAQPAPEVVTIVPAEPLVRGRYGVRWAAAATDGHVLRDSFTFEVAPPAEEPDASSSVPPDAAAMPPPPADPDTTGDGSTAAPPRTVDEAAPAPSEAPSAESGGDEVAGAGDLEQALASSSPDTAVADALGWVGRALVYGGALLAVGGLVYLLVVHEGTLGETRRLVHLIRRAALVVVAGTAVHAAAMVAVRHDGDLGAALSPSSWSDTFSGQTGIGVALAVGGAVAVLIGLRPSVDEVERHLPAAAPPGPGPDGAESPGLGAASVDVTTAAAGTLVAAGSEVVTLVRLRRRDARLAVAGAVAVVTSFAFFGHTVSEGWRPLTSLSAAAHVAAGATWAGGVALLTVALRRRRQRTDAVPGALLVARFASAAMVALLVVAATGVALSWIVLPAPGALWTTGFGRLLMAKVAVVAAVAALGAHNHLRLVPRLTADPFDAAASASLRRSVTAEVIGFAAVVALTAALVDASPV